MIQTELQKKLSFNEEIKQKLVRKQQILSLQVLVWDQEVEIVEVWRHNMEEEILKISHLAEQYNVIGFDTEFPGTVMMFQKSSEDEVGV